MQFLKDGVQTVVSKSILCPQHILTMSIPQPQYDPCHEKANILHMQNKGADQHHYFRYMNSRIPLLSKSKMVFS